MARQVQQRTIESRKKLLKASYELFSEKGYYKTNTKEIVRRAGISIGNFIIIIKTKGTYIVRFWKCIMQIRQKRCRNF